MAVTQQLTSKYPGVVGALPVIPFPLSINNRTLTTVENETIPANTYFVVIDPDADIWIANGSNVAAVPTTDVADSGSAFFKGGVISPPFSVNPGQILSVVSASGATAHVAFWYYAKLSAL